LHGNDLAGSDQGIRCRGSLGTRTQGTFAEARGRMHDADGFCRDRFTGCGETREERGSLNYVLGTRRLWVFDFDGTLSPIVPDRTEAWLHAECARMLRFLAASPWNRVAVISSRALADVAARIPFPEIAVGGGSGLEWELPGGRRLGPDDAAEEALAANRRLVSTILAELGAVPGVDLEDKGWSVAVHFRNATPKSFRRRTRLLQQLRNRTGIKIYRGYEVVEVQFVRGGSKSAGLRRLCRLLGWDASREGVVYAGDDENDATAIRWVVGKGGTGIVVGNRIMLPRALSVAGPESLPRAVYAFSGAPPAETRPAARQAASG
jgi:trehalose-phosphatase